MRASRTPRRRRSLRLGTLAAAVALGLTLGVSLFALRAFASASDLVRHTMDVKVAVGDAREALLDAETGERGFIVTALPEYLEPYHRANERLVGVLARLRAVTADNPRQQRAMDAVDRDARARMEELDRAIETRTREGFDAAVAAVRTNVGKHTMDALRRELGEMSDEEDRLLLFRERAETRNADLAIGALVLTSALFGLLVVLTIAARRTAAERARVTEFQERFVAILGHDLRSPLAALTTGIEILQRTARDAHAPTLRRMRSSALRMERMIAQVLDLTRSRLGGGIPIVPVPADLGATVGAVVDELRGANPERRIVVESRGDLRGTWDCDRLEQVVSNLVGNALHHGAPHEDVRVDVLGEASRVVLSVHNEGTPIPSEVRPVLFDAFRRGAHDGQSERTSGLGLGLFITREIVTAHGGDIAVDSDAERGTTFTVALPRATHA